MQRPPAHPHLVWRPVVGRRRRSPWRVARDEDPCVNTGTYVDLVLTRSTSGTFVDAHFGMDRPSSRRAALFLTPEQKRRRGRSPRDTAQAMSQENIEIVQRGYEWFNRSGELLDEAFDPDVEWHTAEDLPDSGTHRGVDGIQTLFTEWVESFEEFRGDIAEIIDGGDELVIVVVELHGRVKGGSQEVVMQETHVWKFRDGRAFEIREYRTKQEALEATGLSE